MSHPSNKVRLSPMTEQAFVQWSAHLVKAYAADKVKAGHWSEAEALTRARESIEDLLPAGIHSHDHFLYTIIDSVAGQELGALWLGVNTGVQGAGFIFDLEVEEPFRRQGYASAAMKALEVEAKRLGMAKLTLHVFAYNQSAISLYEKLGYEVTDMSLTKTLA